MIAATVTELFEGITCRKCGAHKPISHFTRKHLKSPSRDCNDCVRVYFKNKQRQRREENPVAFKGYTRARNLRKKYGLTLEEFNRILASQHGVCAICKRPPYGVSFKGGAGEMFCVDHDHALPPKDKKGIRG